MAVIRLIIMNRPRLAFRFAVTAALAASLGLAACGRKGPLDPPPGASLAGEPQAHMPNLTSDKSSAAAKSTTVQAPKKHIPLDGLLN
jgi:predicted small lipoprotein YifL